MITQSYLQALREQTEEAKKKEDPRFNEVPPSQTEFDVVFHGMKAFIINDGEGSCVPVIEMSVKESQLVFDKSSSHSVVSAIVKIEVSFYNPTTSRWEAVIEPTALDFDMQLNLDKAADLGKIMILKLNPEYEEINVNLSRELIKIIKHTLRSWQLEVGFMAEEEKQFQKTKKSRWTNHRFNALEEQPKGEEEAGAEEEISLIKQDSNISTALNRLTLQQQISSGGGNSLSAQHIYS